MISFIIPIFNAEKYLIHCLDSLFSQTTAEPLQIILIDDASTDNSFSVARTYINTHMHTQRVMELYSQPHAGQSAARNLGLLHAKGEYIAFVDADDALAHDWCERHLEAIAGVDYVQSGYRRIVADKPKPPKIPRFDYQFTSPCMRLYRRSMLQHMTFAVGRIYEDVLFSVDVWCQDVACRRIEYAGYLYSLNPNGTTSRPHPEEQKQILLDLRKRMSGRSTKHKLIILLTIMRLKMHYILHR